MNRRHVVLLLALFAIIIGAQVLIGTSAFSSGDNIQAGSSSDAGLFVAIADTPNGHSYATIDNGDITLDIAQLNPEAETRIDDVLVVGYMGPAAAADGGEGTASLWIDHNSSAVTFYRMDTREPIESEADALSIGHNESIGLGVKIASGTQAAILDTITLHSSVSDVTLTAQSYAISQPTLSIESQSSPSEAEIGSPVIISAVITNTGFETETREVWLYLDGQRVQSQPVSLAPGERMTVTFTHTFDEPGTYAFEIDGQQIDPIEVGDSTPSSDPPEPTETPTNQTSTPTETPDLPASPESTPDMEDSPGFGGLIALLAVLLTIVAKRISSAS